MGKHDHLIGRVVDASDPAFDGIPANLNGEEFLGGSRKDGWKTKPPIIAAQQANDDRKGEVDSIRGSGSNIHEYTKADIISRVNAATTEPRLRELLSDILKQLVK